MANPEDTMISRAHFTTIAVAATRRFAIVADGTTVELGATGPRDVSGQLQNVLNPAAKMVIVERVGRMVTIDVDVTPTADGNVTITRVDLGSAFAPVDAIFDQGRGGGLGISTVGRLYINPATNGVRVSGQLSFTTSNPWPASLPGVDVGQPIVI